LATPARVETKPPATEEVIREDFDDDDPEMAARKSRLSD
jgi:hypothetical protein